MGLGFIDGQFYAYPAIHAWVACLFYFFGPGGLTSAAMSFALMSLWELCEVIIYELNNGYIFWADSNLNRDPTNNSILLDLGNALLGIVLAVGVTFSNPRVRMVMTPISFFDILYLVLYLIGVSFFSSITWYCNTLFDTDCIEGQLVDRIPWGLIILYPWTLSYLFLIFRRKANINTVASLTIVAIMLLLAVTIKWISTAVTVYIACTILTVYHVVSWSINKNMGYMPI
tara:strand:+ start:596 stop:1282 length:687 start_codon:yes stop_codon:yes gene_type:complete